MATSATGNVRLSGIREVLEAEEVGSEPPAAELNLRILSGLGRYITDHHGEAAWRSLLEQAGIDGPSSVLQGDWTSLEQLEHALSLARERYFGSDADFRDAFGYRLEDSLGPVRFLAWAASPGQVLERGLTATKESFSTISRVQMLERNPTSLHLKYFSDKPESRLVCLSRQGMAASLPTLWDLPRAQFEEASCIGRGDDCCEYRVRWYPHRRRWPLLAGLLAGALLGAGLGLAGSIDAGTVVLLGALGFALAYALEVRRTHRAHVRAAGEAREAWIKASHEEAQARREVLRLSQRQRQWASLMETYASERTGSLEQIIERLQGLLSERGVQIRGMSHDLKNPLQVLKASVHFLESGGPSSDPELVADFEWAIERMEQLLGELVQVAATEAPGAGARLERISVAEFPEMLRGRLHALTFGRDIRVSAFSTREAPPIIEINRIVLDRIIDNLLTNAAKYTESGSIVAEVDGAPGFLVLKISDTGLGIPADRIERIFRPGGARGHERTPGSHGVGLSVVVDLLCEIGGRLEVMSKPDMGTTFWVHLPERDARAIPREDRPSRRESFDNVVHIRKVESA